MTDQHKPLSETHPTLVKRWGDWRPPDIVEDVQFCTVDVAEHERITKEYYDERHDLLMDIGELKAEVERLKKELEQKSALVRLSEGRNDIAEEQGFKEGVFEGERREKQRVKGVIEDFQDGLKIPDENGTPFHWQRIDTLTMLKDKLGLGDEEDLGDEEEKGNE